MKPSDAWLEQVWGHFDWKTLGLSPYPFQQETLEYLLTKTPLVVHRFLARWDMGLGKTVLAVLWCERMMHYYWHHFYPVSKHNREIKTSTKHHKPKGRFVKCIIVAAPTLQENFVATLKKAGRSKRHIHFCYRFWSFEKASHQPDVFYHQCKNNFVVIDEVQRVRTIFQQKNDSKAKANKPNTVTKTTKAAKAGKDEKGKKEGKDEKPATKGKAKGGSGGGIYARTILTGCKRAEKVLMLTGTVIINSLSDIWNISHLMLQRHPFEKELTERWNKTFVIAKLKKNLPLTETQMDLLKEIFFSRMSHQTVEKALSGSSLNTNTKRNSSKISKQSTTNRINPTTTITPKMPKATMVIVVLEMNSEYFTAYQRVEQDETDKLRNENKEYDIKGNGAFWSGLRQAANKINSVQSQKRQLVLEIVSKARLNGQRVVITSAFLSRGLQLIVRSFQKMNVNFEMITGETESAERQVAVDAFNDPNSSVEAIVLSGAGTTGTNLTNSSIQINFESHWNEATRAQTDARSRRLGSKHPHIIIYNFMMAKPGLEFRSFVKDLEVLCREKAKWMAEKKSHESNSFISALPDQVLAIDDMRVSAPISLQMDLNELSDSRDVKDTKQHQKTIMIECESFEGETKFPQHNQKDSKQIGNKSNNSMDVDEDQMSNLTSNMSNMNLIDKLTSKRDRKEGNDENGDLESIDIYLYRMQWGKSKQFQPLLDRMPTWGI